MQGRSQSARENSHEASNPSFFFFFFPWHLKHPKSRSKPFRVAGPQRLHFFTPTLRHCSAAMARLWTLACLTVALFYLVVLPTTRAHIHGRDAGASTRIHLDKV
jgi:hypothetical protein